MRDERVHGQIQRLLDARDQKAFSRLLIDSVCSMQPDDFHRVREKLIRKFIDDQRGADNDVIWPGQLTAKIKTAVDEQLGGWPPAEEEEMLGFVPTSDDLSSSSLSLKIMNVRSCGIDESGDSWPPGDSWPYDVELQSRASVEDFTTTNYITIAPIETTTDERNDNDSLAAEYQHDDQAQHQHGEVADTQLASTTCLHQPE